VRLAAAALLVTGLVAGLASAAMAARDQVSAALTFAGQPSAAACVQVGAAVAFPYILSAAGGCFVSGLPACSSE
jgi:hypothetical protein